MCYALIGSTYIDKPDQMVLEVVDILRGKMEGNLLVKVIDKGNSTWYKNGDTFTVGKVAFERECDYYDDNSRMDVLEYLQDYVHVCDQEELQQVIEEIENLKSKLNGGTEMKNKFVLCMVSYEEKEGMYYDIEEDMDTFDSMEVLEKINNYYSKIGIEEYTMADFWIEGEDTQYLNELMLKNLHEHSSPSQFMYWLEEAKSLTENEALKALVYYSETGEDLREIVESKKYEDVMSIEDPREYLLNDTTEAELPSWIRSLVYNMSDVEAMNFINVNEIANMVQYESEFFIVY